MLFDQFSKMFEVLTPYPKENWIGLRVTSAPISREEYFKLDSGYLICWNQRHEAGSTRTIYDAQLIYKMSCSGYKVLLNGSWIETEWEDFIKTVIKTIASQEEKGK